MTSLMMTSLFSRPRMAQFCHLTLSRLDSLPGSKKAACICNTLESQHCLQCNRSNDPWHKVAPFWEADLRLGPDTPMYGPWIKSNTPCCARCSLTSPQCNTRPSDNNLHYQDIEGPRHSHSHAAQIIQSKPKHLPQLSQACNRELHPCIAVGKVCCLVELSETVALLSEAQHLLSHLQSFAQAWGSLVCLARQGLV